MNNKLNTLVMEPNFILQSLASNSNDYIYICDLLQDSYILSDNMADDFAIEKEGSAFIQKWIACIHKRDAERVSQNLAQLVQNGKTKISLEYQATNTRGNSIWVWDKATIRYSEETKKPELIIGVLHNLAVDGAVDSVTGLLMHDKYEELFELNQRTKVHCHGSVMLIGIDDFTTINTLNNHSFGDLVLRTTALDILALLPDHVSMYRFDGDQFLICAEKMDAEALHTIYMDIKAYTSVSHQINGSSYRFTVSGGIVNYPKDGYTWLDLEKAVSTALKKAKEQGRNQCVHFQKEMLEKRIYEQSLSSYLSDSVASGFKGFSVVYQPVCHAQNLHITGAEALLRFETPNGDLISPLQFIPLLEQSGLIHDAGLWILEQAISTCKKWIYYMADFTMNVNVSYLQLRDIHFTDHVEELLNKYDLDIRHLTLELTESYFITDAPNINESMRRLQELHLQVAMDDFGTGYSSLARLSQFNVDIVKIDRSFIQSLHKSKYNYDFVDSVVRLCHNVGMKVCVEGVETREEQTSICLLNADYIQGFYVAKPIDAQSFFTKFILQPEINDSLIVTPDAQLFQNQLVSDKDILLAMMDSSPLALNFWNRNLQILACNTMVLHLFEVNSFDEFKENFFCFSPEFQPDGQKSIDKAADVVHRAFEGEEMNVIWMHCTAKGVLLPAEVRFVRIPYMNDYIVASYTRDMREQRAMEERIEKFNLRLKTILDATPLCLNLWNKKFENIMCNQEAVKLFDLTNDEEYTKHFFELSPKYQPDGQLSNEKAIGKINEAFANGRTQFFWMHQNLKEEPIPSEITLVRMEGLEEDGGVLVAGFTRDIRTQLEAHTAERKASDRIHAVLDSMPLACILWTLDLEILECNQGAVNLFGVKDKDEIISNFDSFNPPLQPDASNSAQKKSAKFEETLQKGFTSFEWVYQSSTGEPVPCEVTLVKITLEYEELIVAYSRDLRELYHTLEINERLSKIAYHDFLTGCASRAKFVEKLEKNFLPSSCGDLALLIFDVDYFKSINDAHGHDIGDLVLKRVAKRVEYLLPASCMLGRFGGDEFIIQAKSLLPEQLENLMQRLVKSVAALPFFHKDEPFTVTISMGASYQTQSDQNYHDLLNRADEALYEAKSGGRNRALLL